MINYLKHNCNYYTLSQLIKIYNNSIKRTLMKKHNAYISILAATLLSFLTPFAIATPTQHVAIIFCPHVDALTHFGNQIGGYGSESIMDQINRPIFFQSPPLPDSIPLNL